MSTKDDKSMGIISVVGGILVIIFGLWFRTKAGDFTGEWPVALSMGSFIVGTVSIVLGVNKLKK